MNSAGSAPSGKELAVRIGTAVMRLRQAEREYRDAYLACLYECMASSSWGRLDASLLAVRRLQDNAQAWLDAVDAKSGELSTEGSSIASLMLGRGDAP